VHIDVTAPGRTAAALLGAGLGAALVMGVSGCADSAPPPASPSASAGADMTGAEAPECLPAGTQAVRIARGDITTDVAVAGGGARGVVLAPQNGGDWCQWAAEAAHLADEGYRVATFTWPEPGVEAGKAAMTAAVEALHRAGAQEVALVGASKGGTYAVAMADELGAVGVVALSPPSQFDGLDARSQTVAYTGPLLVLASRDDPDVPRDDSYLVARPADGPSFLEIPLAAHGVAMLADAEHKEHVTFVIDDELTRAFTG
jgi:hypothetical protein